SSASGGSASSGLCELCKVSFKARLRQPRPFLRQPFQHRRDDVDVDCVLIACIFAGNGRCFVMAVVGSQLRRWGLDLEALVQYLALGLVSFCSLGVDG